MMKKLIRTLPFLRKKNAISTLNLIGSVVYAWTNHDVKFLKNCNARITKKKYGPKSVFSKEECSAGILYRQSAIVWVYHWIEC